MALWALSDLVSLSASEPTKGAFTNSERHFALLSPAEKLLADVMDQLNESGNQDTPVLLLPTDANARFVAQKLPFDLLPRGAVHSTKGATKAIARVWKGDIVIIGRDRARTSGMAQELVGHDSYISQQEYDGFFVISGKTR